MSWARVGAAYGTFGARGLHPPFGGGYLFAPPGVRGPDDYVARSLLE